MRIGSIWFGFSWKNVYLQSLESFYSVPPLSILFFFVYALLFSGVTYLWFDWYIIENSELSFAVIFEIVIDLRLVLVFVMIYDCFSLLVMLIVLYLVLVLLFFFNFSLRLQLVINIILDLVFYLVLYHLLELNLLSYSINYLPSIL